MKLARVVHRDTSIPALVEGNELVLLDDPELARGNRALELLNPAPEKLTAAAQNGPRVPLDDTELLAPVNRPSKIIAIGLNYADHIAESGMATPEVPTVFAKFPGTVNAPYAPIQSPRVSDALDYEGELGFVIGKRCRHVPRERAAEVIAGYLVVNDVSVRDWQLATPQWSLGKSFDTHAPMGPWVTTADEIDPDDLDIETIVNGEVRQSSNSSQLVFDPFDLVAFLSQAFTLNPGDVIATGTPSGVGGLAEPPVYLAAGDEVTVRIAGLGSITNVVIDEPADSGFIGDGQVGVGSAELGG
jgi:2-keto-4-pentenoate hydratase/2-oxohepta-3-ene-1,7-dioic acid hydratase in catechol pathway